MKKIIPLLMMIFILVLSACAPGSVTQPTETKAVPTEVSTTAPTETETAAPTETEMATDTVTPTEAMTLEAAAELVITALAAKDMQGLADLVHPEMGVRFSPYAYVQEEQLVFTPDQLPGLFESDGVYTWGAYDGTGQPIDLTFSAYFDEFVYSADFVHAEETAVNERLGDGNTINNISEFYPESAFVEYHFSGFDPQYDGLDWQSLRLVFKQEGGQWYLIGIVHDEWTI